MKKQIAAITVTTASIVGACSGRAPETFPGDPTVSMATFEAEVVPEWLESNGTPTETAIISGERCMGDLHETVHILDGHKNISGVPGAIVQLHDHTVPAALTKLGPLALSGQIDDDSHYLVCFDPAEDTGKTWLSDQLMTGERFAMWMPDLQTFAHFPNYNQLSPESRALVDFHETVHKLRDIDGTTRETGSPLEEVETMQKQLELAISLFGPEYARSLELHKDAIREGVQAAALGISYDFSFNDHEIEAFRQPISDLELQFFKQMLDFHAAIEIADEVLDGQAALDFKVSTYTAIYDT